MARLSDVTSPVAGARREVREGRTPVKKREPAAKTGTHFKRGAKEIGKGFGHIGAEIMRRIEELIGSGLSEDEAVEQVLLEQDAESDTPPGGAALPGEMPIPEIGRTQEAVPRRPVRPAPRPPRPRPTPRVPRQPEAEVVPRGTSVHDYVMEPGQGKPKMLPIDWSQTGGSLFDLTKSLQKQGYYDNAKMPLEALEAQTDEFVGRAYERLRQKGYSHEQIMKVLTDMSD